MTFHVKHLYRHFRDHQRAVVLRGGMLTTYPSGRTELTYGSAPYGEHALAAYASAKRHVAFMNTFNHRSKRK